MVEEHPHGRRVLQLLLLLFPKERDGLVAAGHFVEDVVDFGHKDFLDKDQVVEEVGRQFVLECADFGDGAQVVASTEDHSVHKLFRLDAVLQVFGADVDLRQFDRGRRREIFRDLQFGRETERMARQIDVELGFAARHAGAHHLFHLVLGLQRRKEGRRDAQSLEDDGELHDERLQQISRRFSFHNFASSSTR